MTFQDPEGPMYPEYRLSFRHPAITGGGLVRFNLTRGISDESEEDADTAFQKLVDLLSSSGEFEVTAATKAAEYQQQITPDAS